MQFIFWHQLQCLLFLVVKFKQLMFSLSHFFGNVNQDVSADLTLICELKFEHDRSGLDRRYVPLSDLTVLRAV